MTLQGKSKLYHSEMYYTLNKDAEIEATELSVRLRHL